MAFIGNSVQTQGFAPAIDYFSGNGSTVTFTLSRPIASVAQIICAIDNVIQNPSSSFTVSGNSITFTSAPLSGTNNIWVEYTSLITTYAAISQSPSVIGDITTSGGFFAQGTFGNTYIDGTIVDYVTGNGRITAGPADGITLYNGGPTGRVSLLAMNSSGAMGVGTSPSYGTTGQVLQSNGSAAAPSWVSLPYSASYLIVAGGGGSGRTNGAAGASGGAGAGGLIASATTLVPGTVYSFTVGAGGSGYTGGNGVGGNGSNSTGFGLTAIGGGGAGVGTSGLLNGSSGGSGGGAGGAGGTGGSGTTGQGNAGGSSAGYGGSGGGGAGAAGTSNPSGNPGQTGGIGIASSITGSSVYYAGGGGGASNDATAGAAGGLGGGGAGAVNSSSAGTAGTANTGGGAGGSGYNSINGVNGGSGVVILSVPTANYTGTTTGSPTVTTSGSNTIIKFTSSGSYTA